LAASSRNTEALLGDGFMISSDIPANLHPLMIQGRLI